MNNVSFLHNAIFFFSECNRYCEDWSNALNRPDFLDNPVKQKQVIEAFKLKVGKIEICFLKMCIMKYVEKKTRHRSARSC